MELNGNLLKAKRVIKMAPHYSSIENCICHCFKNIIQHIIIVKHSACNRKNIITTNKQEKTHQRTYRKCPVWVLAWLFASVPKTRRNAIKYIGHMSERERPEGVGGSTPNLMTPPVSALYLLVFALCICMCTV